jgi:hypothetical protein
LILKRHVKNTNHHILDRAFLQHLNILQTTRLHLEGAFGDEDPVYEASKLIRETAPQFFSSTILGVTESLNDIQPENQEPMTNDTESPFEAIPI